MITFSPLWLIDFVNTGVVEPLNPYIDKYMNKADMDDFLDVYKSEGYARMGNTWYGLPDDGDVFVLYYRKDLFEDPDNAAKFKAKYGYELAAPETWDQFDDIGNFFTDNFAPDIYGGAIQRLEGQVYSWWMGAFSGNGGMFFDPASMKPGINSAAGVKTLQQMVDQNKWMPPGVEKWGFVEILSAWMDGKVAMVITWPPIGRWSAGYGATVEQLAWVPSTKGKSGERVKKILKRKGLSKVPRRYVTPTKLQMEAMRLLAHWLCSLTGVPYRFPTRGLSKKKRKIDGWNIKPRSRPGPGIGHCAR